MSIFRWVFEADGIDCMMFSSFAKSEGFGTLNKGILRASSLPAMYLLLLLAVGLIMLSYLAELSSSISFFASSSSSGS